MLNCKIVALDFSCENARSQIDVWKKAAAQMLLSVPRSRSTYVDQNVVNRERGCVDFRETIWIETCPNDHFWSQTLDKNA